MKKIMILYFLLSFLKLAAQDSLSTCINIPDITIPSNISPPLLLNSTDLDNCMLKICTSFKGCIDYYLSGTFVASKNNKIKNLKLSTKSSNFEANLLIQECLSKLKFESSYVSIQESKKNVSRNLYVSLGFDTDCALVLEIRTLDYNEILYKKIISCKRS